MVTVGPPTIRTEASPAKEPLEKNRIAPWTVGPLPSERALPTSTDRAVASDSAALLTSATAETATVVVVVVVKVVVVVVEAAVVGVGSDDAPHALRATTRTRASPTAVCLNLHGKVAPRSSAICESSLYLSRRFRRRSVLDSHAESWLAAPCRCFNSEHCAATVSEAASVSRRQVVKHVRALAETGRRHCGTRCFDSPRSRSWAHRVPWQ